MAFYELFSASNLSGINVQLKDGAISANQKMNLDQNSLKYTHSNRVVSLNDIGVNVSSLNSSSVTRIDVSGILLNDVNSSLRVHAQGINSSSDFLCHSTGSVTLRGNGVLLESNSSGIRLSGDILNTSTGPLLNKFLKVHIKEGEVYVPYNIPLMRNTPEPE